MPVRAPEENVFQVFRFFGNFFLAPDTNLPNSESFVPDSSKRCASSKCRFGAFAARHEWCSSHFSSTDADIIHPGSRRSAYLRTIQPHTVKGFGDTSFANSR
eukprot:1338164-Amphidinium_carterae.1